MGSAKRPIEVCYGCWVLAKPKIVEHATLDGKRWVLRRQEINLTVSRHHRILLLRVKAWIVDVRGLLVVERIGVRV